MVRLTVNHGYDIHSIDLDDDVYSEIKAGFLIAGVMNKSQMSVSMSFFLSLLSKAHPSTCFF
jgi:hypothetical protein